MYALPPHTVHLVLQYISPLTDPIPPHLISVPLQQRHHFLQISSSSPVDYLCWPSPDSTKVIDLLDRLHLPPDQTSYPTRYTSDPESTFAHVQISSNDNGLRMLFHWDPKDGWKYHDLRLMPFPHPSFSTPQESLTSGSAGSLSQSSLVFVAEADHHDSSDDGDYWDTYGAAGHDSFLPRVSRPDAVETEDAYWAQYSSVQGSADSTVPSPIPTNRKFRPVNSTSDESAVSFPPHDQIIDVPLDAIHSHLPAASVGPPSPNKLAHLLSTISPRRDAYSLDIVCKYSERSPSAYSLVPSSERTAADSELITPPLPTGSSVYPSKTNEVTLSTRSPRPLDEAEDRALTDSIKGLYYLWKAGGKGETNGKDRTGFLQIVQEAIGCD